MVKILCPVCGSVVGHVMEDTKLVWGTCRDCGAKFTSEGGLNVKEGWVKVGCWEPPKEKLNEEVIDYIKSKGARPFISAEWLSKQEKKGKTFNELQPKIDRVIKLYLEAVAIIEEEEKNASTKNLR